MAGVETRHSAARVLPTVVVIGRNMGMLLIGSSFVLIAPVRELRMPWSKFYASQVTCACRDEPTVSGRLLTRRNGGSGPLHGLRYGLLPLRSCAASTAVRALCHAGRGGSPV